MLVQLVEGTRKNVASYGKFTAKAFHPQTLTMEDVCKEIQNNCGAKASDVVQVLRELVDVLQLHLQAGDKVELPYLGTMKMDIDSKVFDRPEDFNPGEHIKRFKISFIAKSIKGERALFDGVKVDNVLRLNQKKPAK
jgi:hypothetical protein